MTNKCEKCSISLGTKQMQIETTLGFYLTPFRTDIIRKIERTNAMKDNGKEGPLSNVGENKNWTRHHGNWCRVSFLKK